MINDLVVYQPKFGRAVGYALLIHFLIATLFFAKLPEHPLDRLLAKLEQVAALTEIVKQLRTQLAPAAPAAPNQPTPAPTATAQLPLPQPTDTQVELHASPLVADREPIYFISHIVQPGDQDAESSASPEHEADDQAVGDQSETATLAPDSSLQLSKMPTTDTAPTTVAKQVSTLKSANPATSSTISSQTASPATNTSQPLTNQTLKRNLMAESVAHAPEPVPTAPTPALTRNKPRTTSANMLEAHQSATRQDHELEQTHLSAVAAAATAVGVVREKDLSRAPAKVAFAFADELVAAPANLPTSPATGSTNQTTNHRKSSRKPVIRALAPGAYLKYANAQGQHVMSQAGRKGTPSIADLRRLSYQALVMRTFSEAFNAYKVLFNITIPQTTLVYTRFTIDPTGQVLQVQTDSETAAPELLEFVRKTIAYANPFPPVPQHMAGENYIFGPFVITLNPGKLAGQYVWSEGSRR